MSAAISDSEDAFLLTDSRKRVPCENPGTAREVEATADAGSASALSRRFCAFATSVGSVVACLAARRGTSSLLVDDFVSRDRLVSACGATLALFLGRPSSEVSRRFSPVPRGRFSPGDRGRFSPADGGCSSPADEGSFWPIDGGDGLGEACFEVLAMGTGDAMGDIGAMIVAREVVEVGATAEVDAMEVVGAMGGSCDVGLLSSVVRANASFVILEAGASSAEEGRSRR